MNGQQRLLRRPLPPLRVALLLLPLLLCLGMLLLEAPPAGASVLRTWRCSSSTSRRHNQSATAFVGLLPTPAGLANNGSANNATNNTSALFSRGRFRLHPRLRVRHLSRDSGSSHLLELSRQRLLLEREGDLQKYLDLPLLPFPVEGEVHSQRKRSKTPPPGGPPPGPLLLYRKAKQLLMRHSGTSNNRQVLMLRDRLSVLVQKQRELLVDSKQSSVELLRKLWDIKADEPYMLQQQELQQQKPHQRQQHRRYERENSLVQGRRTRPLGSRFLFVCGIDLRMAGTDLENIFQTITEHPVYARLKRNAEGRHLGFGLVEFGSTLDATRCLLQLNGIKIGNSTIRLGEALGKAKEPAPSSDQEEQEQQPQQQQIKHHKGDSRTSRRSTNARYIHPYPLPCE
ncbi:RNA recognition motif-containing protein, putative [Eimeria mitis]|uniref:RNA recognition motif-containing protein, putative n=1 Tax=Eimeria mitis TaxID=44415 RepID=U6K836_9EIME|nr:RNA recognition motif-containing protein, putative [Eimeria mitis]CDJ31658.1 RNA recognition motif-containing protein, putative [Eimeria mitis]